MKSIRENWMRIAALIIALLLAAGYFFLPMSSYQSASANEGRKKEGIEAGESRTWTWTPQLDNPDQLSLELSGAKKAQGITLKAELTDEKGTQVASVIQPIADLGEESRLTLKGSFRKGTVYTLTVSAEGEGSIKFKGDETEDGTFLPEYTEAGTVKTRNTAVLYFAIGMLLLAVTPVFGKKEEKKERGIRIPKTVNGLLPVLTFLMIVVLGMVLILSKPTFVMSYGNQWPAADEETHIEETEAICLTWGKSLDVGLAGTSIYSPGYVPLALGYTVTSFFTKDYDAIYHISVGFALFFYALMAALAVVHAPKYKATFMVLSVLSCNFHVVTSFHYDPTVIISILLGMALLLEVLDQEGPVRTGQGMIMVGLMAFGTVCKSAYSIILLTLMMIPSAKFGGKGKAWIFRIFVLLMLAWVVAGALIPGPYDAMRSGDPRFDGVDAAAQLEGMKAHPFDAAGKLIGFLFNNFYVMFFQGIGSWAYLGINQTAGWILTALLLLVAPLCSGGEEGKSLLTPGRRITFGVLAFGSMLILVVAQYVVSSPVGGSITGMQNRYIIPMWTCIALALMLPQKVRDLTKKFSDILTLGLWAGCFGVNLWAMLQFIQVGNASLV